MTPPIPEALEDQLYPYRCNVWRSERTLSGTGEPTETWKMVASNVPFYLESKPSQFLQVGAGVMSEGDNLFTQDWLHFKADQELEPMDVVKVTGSVNGEDITPIRNAFWRLRGDLRPHVWRAGKRIHLGIRLAAAPSGVS